MAITVMIGGLNKILTTISYYLNKMEVLWTHRYSPPRIDRTGYSCLL